MTKKEETITTQSIRQTELTVEQHNSLYDLRAMSRLKTSIRMDEINKRQIIRLTERLMVGELVRNVSSRQEYTALTYQVPATKWDYLKEFIVRCVPALHFGWLVPKQKTISKQVICTLQETYLNSYPAEEIGDIPRGYSMERVPTPFEWLKSKPPTLDELEAAIPVMRDHRNSIPFRDEEIIKFMLKAQIKRLKASRHLY